MNTELPYKVRSAVLLGVLATLLEIPLMDMGTLKPSYLWLYDLSVGVAVALLIGLAFLSERRRLRQVPVFGPGKI